MNGIDFKKGCYVGQENTSRIKLKNKLSKRLLPIKVLKGTLKIDQDILFQNENYGKILIDGEYPFGLIKFKDEKLNFSREYKCENAIIKISKPEWIN